MDKTEKQAAYVLEVRGLSAGYDGRPVLEGVSFGVRAGEVVGLLGLNGSGKSTLLRAALGLIPARAGDVLIGGERAAALGARRRAQLSAYIPQRSRLDEGMTALEIVLMGANARTPLLGSYARADRRQAMDCLTQMGAGAWAHRQMGTLSQGQQQLVIFARAMMQQPSLLLLDEPDSALDLPRRSDMMAHVRRMTQDGCAALIALHDASLALNACDRVLILMNGSIACSADMRRDDADAVCAAMRALYGDVTVLHAQDVWSVTGRAARPHDAPGAGPQSGQN